MVDIRRWMVEGNVPIFSVTIKRAAVLAYGGAVLVWLRRHRVAGVSGLSCDSWVALGEPHTAEHVDAQILIPAGEKGRLK